MKKILPILFVLFGLNAAAQTVNIPDPVFKAVLVNYSDLFGRTIDTNGDGEIQYSEAETFSSWGGGYYLTLSGKNISDLTGIKAFSALHSLYCSDNNLTSLDVSGMHMESLFCQNNALTSLDISGCGDYLRSLFCGNNNLTSIDLSGQNSLGSLFINNNNLSSLSLNGAPAIWELYCDHNQLSSLDISQTPIVSLDCSDNQLTGLTVKNNRLFNYSNSNLNYFNCSNNPGLQYICADAGESFFLLEYCIQNGMPLMQIDSTCSFSTSSGYSTVNGEARIDLDNNGCSSADPVKPNMLLKLINDNDTAQNLFKQTGASSEYTFYTYGGNYSVVPFLGNPYYSVNPDTLHFTATTGTTQNLNFCISPNGIHNDLDIIINYFYAFGDSCRAMITYKNKGTQTLNGTIQLTFDDNKLNFSAALPPVSNQSTGTLNWGFNNLQPFETRTIESITWYMLPDPVNHLGDTLTFIANIDFGGTDETPSDNTVTFSGPITSVIIPVTIEYFKGVIQAGKHLLSWKANCTSIEARFSIERSTDGRNYNNLESITASNTRCLQPFDFIDNNPAAGINYYRIKMTDVDGKTSYSPIIALLNKKTGFEIVNLVPNPVTSGSAVLNITSAEKQTINIKITDASGKIVQSTDQPVISGFTQLNMNLTRLAAGVYTIIIHTNNGERKTRQFIKK